MNGRVVLFLLNYFLSANCLYSYLSTEEAFLLRDHTLCMGDCFYHDGGLKCVYDWEAHEAECKSTKVKTKKYRTLTGKTCHSSCGKFGETYDWCATKIAGKLAWDRCTKLEVNRAKATYQTDYPFLTCSNECSKRSSEKPWCNTVGGIRNCDPNNKVILFYRFTYNNLMCGSPCALHNNEPYCYDSDGLWNRCYLSQDKDEEISKLSTYLKIHSNHGEYTQNGYKLCEEVKAEDLNSELPDVDYLARHYENEYSTVIVRDLNRKYIVTDNRDPTIQYTVFDTINAFYQDQLVIPLVYRGVVTNHTLRRSETKDSPWPAGITSNYNRMSPTLEGGNRDYKGYLLGPRLGGPTERFNIFPQSNQTKFSRWSYLEADIYNFVDRHAGSYVTYTAVLSYDLTTATTFRPTAIGLSVNLYNRFGVGCDINGAPLGSSVNALGNMFFTNDPNFKCTIDG